MKGNQMQRAQGLPQTGRLLSKRYAPGAAAWAVPAQLTAAWAVPITILALLAAATEAILPPRDPSFYRTIDPPY